MDHGILHHVKGTLRTILVCATTLLAFSCASEPQRATGGGGGAGGGGSGGGEIPNGGAGGSGGVTAAAGGSAQGGASGGGAGGTIPVIACTGDAECAASGLFCEPAIKRCVRCVTTSHCQTGAHCRANACVTPTSCKGASDCASKNQVCDPNRGYCVECVAEGDCATGQACVGNRCAASLACKSKSDCPAPKVCDTNSGKCVNCALDTDCGNGQKCVQSNCRTACTGNDACSAQGMICDPSTSACVQCASPADCPASSYCSAGTCLPDLCDATETMCASGGFVSCNAAGNSWTNLTACAPGVSCVANAGVASCGGPAIDGGGSGDGPSQACSTATADPCVAIPRFAGTQTVDGNGDDMCSVPSFQFDFEKFPTLGRPIPYNGSVQDKKESVVARVAWGSDGLHVFLDVTDPAVQTVSMKDPARAVTDAFRGDSIELYFSSSDNLTGLTGTDTNSMHVTIPASGPAVQIKTNNSNGSSTGVPSELAKSTYAQKTTTAGYAVEALLPWPGGTAPTANAKIRFDIVLNSADANTGSVDDMRDGQLIYYIGTVTGAPTCQGSNDGTVPYCDNRTWCSTTLQ